MKISFNIPITMTMTVCFTVKSLKIHHKHFHFILLMKIKTKNRPFSFSKFIEFFVVVTPYFFITSIHAHSSMNYSQSVLSQMESNRIEWNGMELTQKSKKFELKIERENKRKQNYGQAH